MRIVIDADTADHPSASFYRFTVAEEFAHVLLHRDIMVQIRTAEDLVELHGWSGYQEIDRNAKRLAAALLMPTIKRLKGPCGNGLLSWSESLRSLGRAGRRSSRALLF